MVNAVISGAAQTVTMVAIAKAALALSGGDRDIPVIHGWTLSIRVALVVAAVGLVLKLLSDWLDSWLKARLYLSALESLRFSYLGAHARAPWSAIAEHSLGESQDIVARSAPLAARTAVALSGKLTTGANMAVMLIAAALVSPWSTLVCGIAALAILLLLRPLIALTRRLTAESEVIMRGLNERLIESVALGVEARVFGTAGTMLDRIRAEHHLLGKKVRQARTSQAFAPQLFQASAMALVIGGLLFITTNDVVDVDSISAGLLLMLRAFGVGQRGQNASQMLAEASVYLDFVTVKTSEMQSQLVHSGSTEVERIDRVEFRDVSFHYASMDRDHDVLKGVSFEVRRGEVLGIIGPSGSGKSTLVQLLLRLREPTSGEIRVNGVPMKDVADHSWTSLVAVVAQEPRLGSGDVVDAVRFYRDLPGARVTAALSQAQIQADVESWPDREHTPLGPAGARVSGGQRQRLSLARALAGQPDLLIMDEPTSSLDPISEARVVDAIRSIKSSTTAVIVTHRPSSLEVCDRIMVVVNGVVADLGTPDELRSRSGYYRELMAAERQG